MKREILGDNYLDCSSTAIELGITETTARRMFVRGTIPASKIGRTWYANEKDIKNYIIQGRTGTSGALILEGGTNEG